MAEISIGAAVGEGFGLIRAKPLTVLTWGLIQVLFGVLMVALLGPMFASIFTTAMHQAQLGGGPPSPEMMQAMTRTQSMTYLIDLLNMSQ